MKAKPTMWTAAASPSPVLGQLDMLAPLIGKVDAKLRAERMRKRIERDIAPFRSIPFPWSRTRGKGSAA